MDGTAVQALYPIKSLTRDTAATHLLCSMFPSAVVYRTVLPILEKSLSFI